MILLHVTVLGMLQLASVDVTGALDMYVDRGDWETCIKLAKQQVTVSLRDKISIEKRAGNCLTEVYIGIE